MDVSHELALVEPIASAKEMTDNSVHPEIRRVLTRLSFNGVQILLDIIE